MTDEKQLEPFEARAKNALFYVFGGSHHWPRIKKCGVLYPYWELNYYGDLATYDSDSLTRLVVAAHQYCLRVSIGQSGPGMVKVTLHNRTVRVGRLHERHPDLEELAETCKARGRTDGITGPF